MPKIWVKILANIGKNLSGKYSQNFLHHAEQSTTDAIKTASKTAANDLIGNKIAKKLQRIYLFSFTKLDGIWKIAPIVYLKDRVVLDM